LGLNGYVWFGGWVCLVKLDLTLQKSRPRAKIMHLGPDKNTAHKLNTIELREIKGTTRSNINTRNHT
jgi:hypothetical protein